MYKLLLGLIISTMVVLVACSPQEQEAFVKPTTAQPSVSKSAAKHREVSLFRSHAQVVQLAFPL